MSSVGVWEDLGSDFKLKLSTALWSWTVCEDCDEGNPAECGLRDCPSQRLSYSAHYFHYVEDIIRSYITTTSLDQHDSSNPPLTTFENLLDFVKTTIALADLPRNELLQKAFRSHKGQDQDAFTTTASQELALDLAVQIIFMINCSPRHQSFNLLELGSQHVPWRHNVSLVQFVRDCFPLTAATDDDKDDVMAADYASVLTARNLKKQAGLSLRPTSDLRNHLRLDRKNNIVEIFHHVAFLKEQLRMTRDMPPVATMEDLIHVGALPRQLLLETLDSIQTLLFPRSDPQSRRLLRRLCSPSGGGFDPDCLRFESSSIRRSDEQCAIPTYTYWVVRLSELYEEVETPRPKGLIQQWLERKSGARYIMLATLIGVIFAVLLGIAGLIVGVLQLYVSYMSWKHPVSTS